ncbi:MAG: choice-of-anchor Q domain-containing protein [Polyangia bacterium]
MPTKTMLPASGSAVGQCAGCPPIDQRRNPRPSACALGAVEASSP